VRWADDVDEARQATGPQHARHLGHTGFERVPVVGAVARGDHIEAGVLEGQGLGRGLSGAHVDQAAVACRHGHRGQHRAGQVASDHLAHQRGQAKADVAAPATHIERTGARRADVATGHLLCEVGGHLIGQGVEVLALRVHGTVQIGLGAAVVLGVHNGVVGGRVHRGLRVGCLGVSPLFGTRNAGTRSLVILV
jgi:hypothetical protein